MTGVSYDDLVAAATIGLSRRPLSITGLCGAAGEHAGVLDGGDAAAALLDATALMVAARRAGARPVPGVVCPAPAAADTVPELPARAADLLERAQQGHPAVLVDLLAATAGHGYRAPAPLLPALLDAAVRDAALRPAVAAVLGARGRWLAGHRGDWRRVAAAAPATTAPATTGPGPAPDDPATWETGSRSERRGYLAALRDRDPAAARELLAAGWSRETGDDRADLLAVLARGLSAADEEFLEAALDDRKGTVRGEARRLLARLPGSAFTRRAAGRGVPLLRLDRRRLVATLPDGADEAALRDGIDPWPPSSRIGSGAWLLTQMIAAVPLAGWVTSLGLDPGPLVSMPVAGNLRVDVHAGWRLAAIDQGSSPWAEALLGVPEPGPAAERPPGAWPRNVQLTEVLSPAARTARAAAVLASAPESFDAIAEVAGCPGPWPDSVADAVIAALRRAVAGAAKSAASAGWVRWREKLAVVAGRGLPVTSQNDYADALARLAETDHCPPHWSTALRHAARTVALRRAFLEEIR
jgi:Family of unknown function (DUF5691)